MVRLPFLLFLSFRTMAAVWEAISPSCARTSSLWWAIPSDCGPSPFCLKLHLWGTTMKKFTVTFESGSYVEHDLPHQCELRPSTESMGKTKEERKANPGSFSHLLPPDIHPCSQFTGFWTLGLTEASFFLLSLDVLRLGLSYSPGAPVLQLIDSILKDFSAFRNMWGNSHNKSPPPASLRLSLTLLSFPLDGHILDMCTRIHTHVHSHTLGVLFSL